MAAKRHITATADALVAAANDPTIAVCGAMRRSRVPSGRRRALCAAGVVWLTLGCSSAFAADPPNADDANLRAEVARLTALVQSLAQHDEALSAQVKALQARLEADDAAASAAHTATPRAIQNAPLQPILEAGPTATAVDANVAVPEIVQNSTHSFTVRSADGAYSIGLFGIVQFDSGATFDFHPASTFVGPQGLSTGVNARRARIGVAGTIATDWAYAFVYDAGNSQDSTPRGLETAQIIWTGPRGTAWELGYSNTYFTLDQSTGAANTLFLERASPSNIATSFNTGDNRANAGGRIFGDRYWFGGYLTGPATGDTHTQAVERFGAFERGAFQVAKGDHYSVHLGVGLDQLIRAPNSGPGTPSQMTLSDQPELRIDPTTFLDTGKVGSAANPVTSGQVFNVETAATWWSLFWQGEYYHYAIERMGLPTSNFNGGYGQLSWTLTGEAHAYNPQSGSYLRVMPANPFSLKNGGWGAWEVAGRVSYVDLQSNYLAGEVQSDTPAAILGGKQLGVTLGLNWYPNDLVRLELEYNYIDYRNSNAAVIPNVPLGAPIGATFSSVALRTQVAY